MATRKVDKHNMTNNKQQTAVEWYAIEMANYLKDFYGDGIINIDILKQAKEMEKEETIKFTEDWYFNGPLLGVGIDVKSTIEQHFNNTYGGGEQ